MSYLTVPHMPDLCSSIGLILAPKVNLTARNIYRSLISRDWCKQLTLKDNIATSAHKNGRELYSYRSAWLIMR